MLSSRFTFHACNRAVLSLQSCISYHCFFFGNAAVCLTPRQMQCQLRSNLNDACFLTRALQANVSPLWAACASGHTEAVRLLLQTDRCDVNVATSDAHVSFEECDQCDVFLKNFFGHPTPLRGNLTSRQCVQPDFYSVGEGVLLVKFLFLFNTVPLHSSSTAVSG